MLSFLALRPASDGDSLPRAALVLGALAMVTLLWPVAARSVSVLPVAAVLVAAQVGAHALVASAAGGVSGPAQLVCCPSAAQVRPGPLGELTANAGWLLFGVQLGVCLLLALLHCGGRRLVDGVGTAVRLLAPRVRAVVTLLVKMHRALAPRGQGGPHQDWP